MATTFMDREVVMVPDKGPAAPREVRAARVWGMLRIALGWTFLWAFLDKAFALGFATGRNPETGAIETRRDELEADATSRPRPRGDGRWGPSPSLPPAAHVPRDALTEVKHDGHERATRHAGTRIASILGGLPPLSWAGAVLLVAGLLLDLVAHLGPWRQSPLATGAHMLALAGAALAMIGAILVGIRRGRMTNVGRLP
jgi:hypothetical protein